MDTRLEAVEFAVEGQSVCGTLLSPNAELPGVLFAHGWGGSQQQDLGRARQVAGLGCVCLTFDLRGHERTAASWETVNRRQNLADLLAAYDWLSTRPNVDESSIAVVGISYGGYLAALLTALRSVRWLVLRSPALYKDEGWELAKRHLNADPDLNAFRRRRLEWQENRALRAAAEFRGDVLIVEAEHDEIVPSAVIDNYVAAFTSARSLTRRRIAGADHGFTPDVVRMAYTDVLIAWLGEMVIGAREQSATDKVREHDPLATGA